MPVNQDHLNQRGLNGFMHSDEVYGANSSGGSDPNYMDPNAFESDVSVQVHHVYSPQKNPECLILPPWCAE